MTGRRRTELIVLFALGLIAMSLQACGESNPTKREAAFCGGLVTLDANSSPGGPTAPTSAEVRAYGQKADPTRQVLKGNAPKGLARQVTALDTGLSRAATGDPGALGDDYQAAKERIEAWAFDNCDYQKLALTATDYRFDGVPSKLKAGNAAVRLKNNGKDFHIVLFLRRPPGDDSPAAQLLGRSFGELASTNFNPDKSLQLGFVDAEPAGAPPGGTGGATLNLTPGRYVLFCPVGTNGNDQDPHFAHGMFNDVTVSS